MTGEITLHGNVLPIGGLKEKSMAAFREGISTVLIPEANKPDLYEVDEEVKRPSSSSPSVTFLRCSNMHSSCPQHPLPTNAPCRRLPS